MASISMQNIVKRYDDGYLAVDDVSLEVADGEFVILVGPSGCGKSTLLRMIAGLEEVTDGAIFIGDDDVTDKAPQQRDIAMVFQNYALYPHMSVRQNLGYSLKVRRTSKDETRRRVEEVARLVPRRAAYLQAVADVLPHAHVRIERVALEDHRDVAAPRREVGHVGAADRDLPRGHLLEAGDHPQQRRLAATGRADEHHELAVADLQADVVDGGDVAGVDLRQLLELDLGHGPDKDRTGSPEKQDHIASRR